MTDLEMLIAILDKAGTDYEVRETEHRIVVQINMKPLTNGSQTLPWFVFYNDESIVKVS